MNINENYIINSVIQDKNEKIINQYQVIKYNKNKSGQKRNLILTNKNLYNVRNKNFLLNAMNIFSSNAFIKRQINIKDIFSIVYSYNINQILLHLPNKFDYLLEFKDRDNFIIDLFRGLNSQNINSLKIVFTDKKNLAQYTNHKSLIKKGVIKEFPFEFINMKLDEFQSLINEKNYAKISTRKDFNSFTNENELILNLRGYNIENTKLNVLNILGQGGFGTVYLIEIKEKWYALKEIEKKFIIKNNYLDEIKNEWKIFKKINHKFLCRLFKFYQNTYHLYYLMPYVCNGNLENILKVKGNFSETEVLFYISQIIVAFEFLHEKGIIYSDLKPENILIDNNGYIKLCDFGASKFIKDVKDTYTKFIGTQDYVAPEIIEKKKYSYKLDYYSLGILIIKLLFGNSPYQDLNYNEIFYKKINEKIIVPSYMLISNECLDFIKNCLKKVPEERFQNLETKDLKNHKWIKNINIDDIINYKIKPPYMPEKKNFENIDLKSYKIGKNTINLIEKHQDKFNKIK